MTDRTILLGRGLRLWPSLDAAQISEYDRRFALYDHEYLRAHNAMGQPRRGGQDGEAFWFYPLNTPYTIDPDRQNRRTRQTSP